MKEDAPTETSAFGRFSIPGVLGQLLVHLLTGSRLLHFLAHPGEKCCGHCLTKLMDEQGAEVDDLPFPPTIPCSLYSSPPPGTGPAHSQNVA